MKGTLLAPDKAKDIADNAYWLAGEGAGAWFVLEKRPDQDKGEYRIKRFAADGTLHCNRRFQLIKGNFNPELPFKFSYPSHCALCTIIQNNQSIILKYKKESPEIEL